MKNILKKLSLFLLAAAMLLSMNACGSTASTESAVPSDSLTESTASAATSGETATYTDMAGREVALSKDIQKIICVRYMEVYMMAAILGDELDDKVISLGLSLKGNDNDGYEKLSESLDMDNMTDIGSIWDDNINVEKVLELDPDIIIVDTQFKEKSCVDKMIEAGLPVVFTDISTDPIYGTLDSMEMLGEMLGKEDRINELVSYARGKTESLFERVDEISGGSDEHPSIYFEQGNVTPEEVGISQGDSSGSWGYLMDKLGAVNIGEGLGYVELDPETVLSDDPDVIVIGGSNWDADSNIMRMGYFQTAEEANEHLSEYVTARAGWSQLSAIQNHRLYAVHFNAEIYPFSFAVYEALAKDLYPEELSDLDPQADLEEFFELYMPYSYSGIFFTQWNG